jgi:GNAT superfamily N-acetyltransferase
VQNSSVQIQLISSKETYVVRHPVLREGRPIESCHFEGDDLDTTFHLGLFLNKELVGVASFMKNNNVIFTEQHQYQLRGMAILKQHQGLGFGDQLLKHGEQLLKNKNTALLWFNAREIAIKFYKKNGHQILGNAFEIKGVGTHYVMFKKMLK